MCLFYLYVAERENSMKKILVLDEQNYDSSLDAIYRIAVRGIIFVDGKLLLIQSAKGAIKFPGGGQEANEDDLTTLTREVLEETGYHILKDTVQEFGEVEEIRLSKEGKVWHQFSRYYFCDISQEQSACSYTESEQALGFKQVWLTLEQAIHANYRILSEDTSELWVNREYKVLELLQKELL